MSELRERLATLLQKADEDFTSSRAIARSVRPALDKYAEVAAAFCEQQLQAALAAVARKAAEIARKHDGDHDESGYVGRCENDGYCPSWITKEIEGLLTPDLAAALAERERTYWQRGRDDGHTACLCEIGGHEHDGILSPGQLQELRKTIAEHEAQARAEGIRWVAAHCDDEGYIHRSEIIALAGDKCGE